MSSLDIPNACTTSANEPVGTTSLEAASCNLGHLDRVSNSVALTSTNRLGRVVPTIAGLNAQAQEVFADAGGVLLGDGVYGVGIEYTNRNQYLIDSGIPYKVRSTVTLPYTTTTATAIADTNLQPFNEVTNLDLLTSQEQLLGSGSRLYSGSNGGVDSVVVNGDDVPTGTTHLKVTVGGSPKVVSISSLASGLVTLITEVGCTIGGTPVNFYTLPSNSIQSDSNRDDKHFISCIPRVSSGGVLSLLNDLDHETLGFSSASQVGDFIMRINYTDTYTQVNNLSITIDDELCKYGVFTGGSVGVAHTDFTAYAQLSGLVDTTAMTFTGSGLFPDGNAVSVSYVDDVLIIDHDNHAFTQDSVVVNQVYGLSFMTKFGVSQNASQINIIPWTEFEGSLIYDGSAFVLDPTKPSLISSTQAGITYEWDGTVNALKVTHPLATGSVVFVQAELGGYTEYNVEVNSLSSFRVYFYTSNGTQITAPNTNMKIMFSRSSCQVRGKIPTGSKFHIRAGMTPVRSANIGGTPGNNFFVSGVMQERLPQ